MPGLRREGAHALRRLVAPTGGQVEGLGTLGSRAGGGRGGGAGEGAGTWWGGVLCPSAPPSGLEPPALAQSPCFCHLAWGGGGSRVAGRLTATRRPRWPCQAVGRGVGIRPLPELLTACRLLVVGLGWSWQEAAAPSPPCPLLTGQRCGREPGSALWPCRSLKFKPASLRLLPSLGAWQWGRVVQRPPRAPV